MFSVDTQKQASSIAFQHDAAPSLLIEYLRALEKEQVVLDLMTALKKLEKPGHRLTVLMCGQHDIALSQIGFVRLLNAEVSVLRGIKTLTTADIVRVRDLQQAKLDINEKIVEFTADFSNCFSIRNIFIWSSDLPVASEISKGTTSQEEDLRKKTDDKVKHCCCLPFY